MAGVDNVDAIIEKYVDEIINKKIAKARVVGKEIMKEKRKAIVYEWFKQVDPTLSTMNAAIEIVGATQAESHLISKTKNSAIIEFISYIDGDMYSPDTRSAERWVSKHGGEMEPKEWILELQLKSGIVGLPEYASTYEMENGIPYEGRGWSGGHNLFFHNSNIGLEDYIDNHGLWDSFKEELEEKLNRKEDIN